jgi:monoamine oxidase
MEPSDVLIRPAARHEIPGIEDLCVSAYAEYLDEVPSAVFDAYLRDLRRPAAHRDEAAVMVAEADGRIAGCVLFYDDASREGLGLPQGWAGFGKLAVRPDMRGRGIGRELVEHCVHRARRIGSPTIGLHTASFMKAARGIYERMGFRRCPEYDLTASEMLGVDGSAREVEVIGYRLDLAREASKEPGRREFLRLSVALGAGTLAGWGSGPGAAATGGQGCSGERVVVLGGGLAGLTAACRLMTERHEVILLEGQDRVGGRVLTVRDGFEAGGHAEMGATRIFGTHAATLRYVELFGLGPLVPYDSGNGAFYLRGARFAPPPVGRPWPIAGMSEAEKDDPYAFLGTYLGPGFEMLGDVDAAGWPSGQPSALELDKVTVEEFLRGQGASRGWIDWFCALEGNVRRLNAFAGLATERLLAGFGGEPPTSIPGGNDRLPEAFAAALGDRVKLRCKVVRLEQNANGVAVTYVDKRGRQSQVRADRCVCALPFSTLRKVVIATPFTADKMRAIETLRYMPVARCCFQTRTRFWAADPLGPLGGLSLVGSDTFAGRIWNTSSQQADPAMGMIQSYMFDTDATEYSSLPYRVGAMRRHISDKLLPGLSQHQVVAAAEKVWQDDPWVEGGWAWSGRGEMRGRFQARGRAEGRVHFAGEHTSPLIGWMTTAIESGERAADEIIAAGC